MYMHKEHNWPLYIGVALPIVFILIILGVLYMPSLFLKPQYDFLYVTGSRYAPTYTVTAEGALIEVDTANSNYPMYAENNPYERQRLYVYDVSEERSQEISYADAVTFVLNRSIESSDGFVVEHDRHYGGGLFAELAGGGSRTDYQLILRKGSVSKRMNEPALYGSANFYYDRNFTFLAWIEGTNE